MDFVNVALQRGRQLRNIQFVVALIQTKQSLLTFLIDMYREHSTWYIMVLLCSLIVGSYFDGEGSIICIGGCIAKIYQTLGTVLLKYKLIWDIIDPESA